MTDVALFPIPECVSFPGAIFPLHVFEPRYRAMIRYCTEQDMPLGVCHTQKLLHPGKQQQSLEEALNSNQATYKPYPVFSAGRCEIVETLNDGRILINVHIDQRYRIRRARQTLPFSIYDCEPYDDEPVSEADLAEAALLQQKMMRRLLAITAGSQSLQALLNSEDWQTVDPVAFSFKVMGLLKVNGDFSQHVLESRSPVLRLQSVLELLNR